MTGQLGLPSTQQNGLLHVRGGNKNHLNKTPHSAVSILTIVAFGTTLVLPSHLLLRDTLSVKLTEPAIQEHVPVSSAVCVLGSISSLLSFCGKEGTRGILKQHKPFSETFGSRRFTDAHRPNRPTSTHKARQSPGSSNSCLYEYSIRTYFFKSEASRVSRRLPEKTAGLRSAPPSFLAASSYVTANRPGANLPCLRSVCS